jgi:hypothetical protein
MHPTVLHEDSTLVSGDFPGLARQSLQEHTIGRDCPVVYHMGTAGNQSPRHVTHGNTFDEAARLGRVLADAVAHVLPSVDFQSDVQLAFCQESVELPLRTLPSLAVAQERRQAASDRLDHLRRTSAPRTETRTAECDWFGAEETVTLARAQQAGEIAAAAGKVMPAIVQVIRVGRWKFVGWPGEVFVEYGQAVRRSDPHAFVITLVGSDLQGYLVTQEGIDKGWYEANNAIFQSPQSPNRLVEVTRRLISQR